MSFRLFLILALVFACTKKNDPFDPSKKEWLHYQTKIYPVKGTTASLQYNFTLRFEESPKANIFFLEVNSFDEQRKHSDGNYEVHQTQIYGEFELNDGKLKLNYKDSVVNHKYCDWTLSHIGFSETVPFYFDSKKNQFQSKIKGEEQIFYHKKSIKVDPKYFNARGVYDEKDCEFFKTTLGPEKGFFN